MRMAEVAGTFEALERTTSRTEITRILGQLFRQATGDEAGKLVYLLEGRLGPLFEPVEFGVDERLILRALAEATGLAPGQVEEVYRRTGDVGSAGEELLRGESQGLSLADVYDALRAIAEATGPGAQERKVRLLRGLLVRLGGNEARYVLRVVQGRLRLGVGEATVMDALSWAIVGHLELRATIERAFNVCSDLGFVATVLLTEGPEALLAIQPRPGRPVRVELAERLPSPQAVVLKLGTVQAEPKYDGLRVELHKDGERIWLFTRRLEPMTETLPELASAARRQIQARQAILDGEAVAYNPETGEFRPFQTTVRRKRKHAVEEMEVRFPLRLFVFDLLYLDGEDCTPYPLDQRRQKLEEALRWTPDDPIQPTPRVVTGDAAAVESFFEEMLQRGLEGLVVKRLDAPYQAGQRSFNWVKLKRGYRAELRDTVDVVVVGYLLGRGRRARLGIGSLLGAVYDPRTDRYRTVSKVGSGLTDEEWQELRARLDETRVPEKPRQVDSVIQPDVWVEPRYVVEVQADEITRSPLHTCGKVDGHPGYALRFPRVVRLRFDRRPQDATTEEEILGMYRAQPVARSSAA